MNNPVTGQFAEKGASAAFEPRVKDASGRFNITISGDFSAKIALERSFDGGDVWVPCAGPDLARFECTSPMSVSAEEIEEGVVYRLVCDSHSRGSASYRISQ